MSREEAHPRRSARTTGATPGAPPPEPPDADAARPKPPLFTARTDRAAGTIRARGHLDVIGADVL